LKRDPLGRATGLEESAWIELMMRFHEVLPLINLAALRPAAGLTTDMEPFAPSGWKYRIDPIYTLISIE
jgi:hypothetical protein